MAALSATARRRSGITRNLREDFALAMATDAGNVDREAKVLKRVKMLGGSSPNSHDVEGVTGTDYLYEAVERAAPLYEGVPAFSNHPPREHPDEDRDIRDAMGIYHNVVAERCKDNPALGELYGDLHLVPSHSLTESMLDVAQNDKLKGLYKLSHNARGTGEVKGGRYVITQINKTRSCDVVDRGATTKNLFESERRSMAKTTLGKVLLEAKHFPAKTKAILLEMDDLMAEPVDEPAAEPEEADWKDHLTNAIANLVKSDDPEAHKKAKSILGMLAPEKAEEIEEDEEEDDTAESDNKKPKDEDEDAAKQKEEDEKQYKESLAETKELIALIVPGKVAATLIESAARLRGAKRMAFIRDLKEAIGGKASTKQPPGAPRTQNGVAANLTESNKYDDLLGVQIYG